jgi:hypothetical protein
MEDRLKQVWAASAAVETLQVEMDQAKALLEKAIDDAVKAGADPEAVRGAAKLVPLEAGQDVAPLSGEPA